MGDLDRDPAAVIIAAMKLVLAFALTALTTLAGCKKGKTAGEDQVPTPAPASGSSATGSAAGAAAGSDTAPPAPPVAPPARPPAAAGPTIADVTKELGAVLASVAEGIDVATMHGCAESVGRVDELFEKSADAEGEDLHGWLADPRLLAEAQAVMKDAKDPAIAVPLATIDAATKDCKKAADVVAEWKAKLVAPD